MTASVDLIFDEQAATAYRAQPNVVRALIPVDTRGAYVLLNGHSPFYVGRSDHCLRERIAGHQMLWRATHVAWTSCSTATAAYHLESAYFHMWAGRGSLLNRIHPAKPAGSLIECPFCGAGDCLALRVALGQTTRPAVPVVTDFGGDCKNRS
jgi:hypothetical protein